MNKAFLAKAIDRAQHLVIGDPFCNALHEFIFQAGVLGWDDRRALFWVDHPNGPPQIAVWLMPIASTFEPRP